MTFAWGVFKLCRAKIQETLCCAAANGVLVKILQILIFPLMCNDFLPWKTLCRHYGRNNESVNAGLSKFQGLAARNVEIGVHMQTQPFNKHGISAELRKKKSHSTWAECQRKTNSEIRDGQEIFRKCRKNAACTHKTYFFFVIAVLEEEEQQQYRRKDFQLYWLKRNKEIE